MEHFLHRLKMYLRGFLKEIHSLVCDGTDRKPINTYKTKPTNTKWIKKKMYHIIQNDTERPKNWYCESCSICYMCYYLDPRLTSTDNDAKKYICLVPIEILQVVAKGCLLFYTGLEEADIFETLFLNMWECVKFYIVFWWHMHLLLSKNFIFSWKYFLWTEYRYQMR